VATWSGWQAQFLRRAGIIVTPPNMNLLTLWSQNAHRSCRNNPIDLTHPLGGSSNCGASTGIFPHEQNYTSHAQAATAFSDEIHMPFAKALLDALNSGNPFDVAHPSPVGSVFVSWGSPAMLNAYLNHGSGSGGGSGGGGGTKASHTHTGWHDLRRSVNHNMPKSIRHSVKLTNAALRALGHGRKVRR
jgi:hypothetical protein